MGEKLGTCSTCEHWKERYYGGAGDCRNRSPVVDPQAHLGSTGTSAMHGPKTLWPETTADDWCGDHMNKVF